MVITNTADVIKLCQDIMFTKKQKVFFDAYVRNNLHMGNTINELGITHQGGGTYLKCLPIKFCLELYKMEGKQIGNQQFTPSVEWITTQWSYLYKKALAAGDDKEARANLSKIMDLKKIFGDLLITEKDGVQKMSNKELATYIAEQFADVNSYLKKGEWFEEKVNISDLPEREIAGV